MRSAHRPRSASKSRRSAPPKKGGTWRTFILLGFMVLLVLGARISLTKLPTAILSRSQSVKGSAESPLIKSLEAAILKYQAEYGKLPLLPEWTTEVIPAPSSGRILHILMGLDTQANPRGIHFFEPQSAQEGRNGFIIDPEDQVQLLDTEGRPYLLHFDLDGDGLIPNPDPTAPDSQKRLPGPVLIFSAGPDRDARTWADNIKNW